MIELWLTLKHLALHLGPATATAAIVAWMSWRMGQLSNGKRAAALALAMPPTPQQPIRSKSRFPLTVIILAIVMGIGIGVPVATVVIALNAGGPVPATSFHHHGG
jgi:heme A synthase